MFWFNFCREVLWMSLLLNCEMCVLIVSFFFGGDFRFEIFWILMSDICRVCGIGVVDIVSMLIMVCIDFKCFLILILKCCFLLMINNLRLKKFILCEVMWCVFMMMLMWFFLRLLRILCVLLVELKWFNLVMLKGKFVIFFKKVW